MLTMGKLLKNLRENKQVTQKELGSVLGVTRDVVANWETDRALPGTELLPNIADYFEVTTDYLLGKTEQFFHPLRNNRLLILDSNRAVPPILADENIAGYSDLLESLHADFVLRVTGDHMIGAGILEGDYAICRKTEEVTSGQIAVVIKDTGSENSEQTLMFFFDNGTGPILRPANPNYPEIHISNDYRIAGVMVALIRQKAPEYLVYRDYLKIAGHEEWAEVIELASQAGIKPGHLKSHIDMLVEMGKKQ